MRSGTILPRILSLVLILAIVGGCTSKVYKHEAAVDEAVTSSLETAGTATIEGEVRIETKYNEVQTGADATIYLVPVTAYTTEWFDRYVMLEQKMDGKDPRSFLSAYAVTVDNDGHFAFQAIPPGAYYVTCNVHYPRRMKMGRFTFSLRTVEAVEAYAKIHVAAGEKAQVLVTR